MSQKIVNKKKVDEFIFSITPYEGYESEIKKMLDANREEKVTLNYLKWRYTEGGEIGANSPLIFWIHTSGGSCVGMSSLIFRVYWKNNKKLYFAVSGDTSINKIYRRKGLGEKLFRFKTEYLKKENICTFGIGTSAAARLLANVGWEKVANLTTYVYFLDSSRKLYEKTNQKIISKILGKIFDIFCKVRLTVCNTRAFSLKSMSVFDDTFEKFWEKFDKNGIILRDRSLSTLEWRYSKHPHHHFEILKIFKHKIFVGFLVYKIDNYNTVTIYDFLVNNEEHCLPGLSLFVKYLSNKKVIYRVSMGLINENHIYAKVLRKIGFFNRHGEVSLQMFIPNNLYEFFSYSPLITQGDKDI